MDVLLLVEGWRAGTAVGGRQLARRGPASLPPESSTSSWIQVAISRAPASRIAVASSAGPGRGLALQRVTQVSMPGDEVAGHQRAAVLKVGHEDPRATVHCAEDPSCERPRRCRADRVEPPPWQRQPARAVPDRMVFPGRSATSSTPSPGGQAGRRRPPAAGSFRRSGNDVTPAVSSGLNPQSQIPGRP